MPAGGGRSQPVFSFFSSRFQSLGDPAPSKTPTRRPFASIKMTAGWYDTPNLSARFRRGSEIDGHVHL